MFRRAWPWIFGQHPTRTYQEAPVTWPVPRIIRRAPDNRPPVVVMLARLSLPQWGNLTEEELAQLDLAMLIGGEGMSPETRLRRPTPETIVAIRRAERP